MKKFKRMEVVKNINYNTKNYIEKVDNYEKNFNSTMQFYFN